jgi:hypothetical protein
MKLWTLLKNFQGSFPELKNVSSQVKGHVCTQHNDWQWLHAMHIHYEATMWRYWGKQNKLRTKTSHT